MKVNTTNESLLAYDQEFTSWHGTGLELLLRAKIQKFYQDNVIRINSIKEKRMDLVNKYLVVDKGVPKVEGEGKDKRVVMQDESLRKEFEDAMQELMKKENVIEI